MAWVTLRRTWVRNAVDNDVVLSLEQVVIIIKTDGSVRRTVLTAVGKQASCASAAC
ncbi:enoyl-CoA hydratase [compost metagenome]